MKTTDSVISGSSDQISKPKHNTTKKLRTKSYMRNTFSSMKKQSVKFESPKIPNFCTSLKYSVTNKPATPLKTNSISSPPQPTERMTYGNTYDWDEKRSYEDVLGHFTNSETSFGLDPYNHFS